MCFIFLVNIYNKIYLIKQIKMSTFKEVLFVGDENDTATSIHCYDIELGVRVITYKGGNGVAKGTLNLVCDELIASAESSKPVLHFWALNKEERIKRMTLPGKVTALSVSHNGVYCVAAIDNKIYVWNLTSGQLLNVIVYHHEPITKIIFWNCSYFITLGSDGLIAVWRLADVISRGMGEVIDVGVQHHVTPFFSSTRHSLPVTDGYLAVVGSTARLFTVSPDQTCQLHFLGPDSGRFLLTLAFDFALTSVVVDRLQTRLYVGTNCGKIILFNMEPHHGVNMQHVNCSDDENNFIGHSGLVNSLALSQEDTILASGSEDKKVILWNTLTKQQIGVYQTFGSVSSVLFHVITSNFLTNDYKPSVMLSNLERVIVSEPENIEIKISITKELTCNETMYSFAESRKFHEIRSTEMPSALDLGHFGESSVVSKDRGNENIDANLKPNNSDFEGMDHGETDTVDNDVHDHKDSSSNQSQEILVNYDVIEQANREISRLRSMNKKLKRINKRLYSFGLQQAWQNRYAKNTNMN